jgi:predicted transposase/invertase (TIGR01784 family)
MAVYINPYTDFGFKKLFGEPASKDLLIDFLNQMLPAHHQIADLVIENPENLGDNLYERRAFFDIHCTATNGERFIVEMQKAKVNYFKDRALFYLTYPIRQQAKVGEWNFQLSAIYFIAILDFYYEEQDELAKFRRDVQLKDQDGEVFFDKLTLKFLQMPAFKKTEAELETRFDKWCYFLKNLANLSDIPQILRGEPLFEKAFDTAEYANLPPAQQAEYEKSRLVYLEVKNVVDTAREEGREEGIDIGEQTAVLALLKSKFGVLDDWEQEQAKRLVGEIGLEATINRILTAQSVAEVFGGES